MQPKTLLFSNGTKIVFENQDAIKLTEDSESLILDDTDKPHFVNEATGETVIEYTGLATDKRADRSWAHAIFKKDGGSPKHYHNEREEFYYIISGQAKIVIDDVVSILSKGEFVHIQPKQHHQVFSIGDDPLEMLVKCSPAWIFEDQHPV